MKPTSFSMKTALLATLIISGKTFAQSLPDEINHPQYLKVYQNLAQVLTTKTAEFDKLSAQKAEIEKTIAAMVKDQTGLPARNAELERLIDAKRAELTNVQTQMVGLEGVLSKILEDLRRIDAMLSQLQRDSQEEQARSQQIQGRRNQVVQDVNRLNARLQQERSEEQQSINQLASLNRGLQNDLQNRNQDMQERADLQRDVERFKRELPAQKSKVASNTQASSSKKAQVADANSKLPAVRTQIASEQAALDQADTELNPKKAKLAELKAELGRQMPEVANLQKEIATLTAKIEANKTKINASGLTALIAKKDALEKELAGVNTQISDMSDKIVAMKEAIKPELAQQIDVRAQIAVLQRSGANPTELARLKNQLDAMEKALAPKRLEIARTEKQYDTLVLSVAPKNQELNNTKDSIVKTQATVASLVAENEAAQNKIAEDQKIIQDRMAANSGLTQQINELEASINALSVNRDRLARSVTQLRVQETTLTSQIASLTKEIQQLDSESAQLSKSIADMEKSIADAPLNQRRLELHMQKMDEQIQAARLSISREEKLLARIQMDRAVVERDAGAAQAQLNQINGDLAQSNQLIGALQGKIQQETQNRDALTRYNQDSIRKYDALKSQKESAENVIADSNKEIADNDQDIDTIEAQLPVQRSSLATVTPKVAAAEKAMNDAQGKADDANDQYQNRMSLYQRYLSESQSLGTERANIGTTDGVKAGTVEGRTKATKLATESAASEAKWVAMRRGYIRGEIGGYDDGFDQGIASSADASQGDADGKVSGAKRAKDQANLVLKPEFFLSELNRRLVEDEVSNKMKMAMLTDEVNVVSAMKMMVKSDVPELTQDEINASQRILSSLDSLIEQSLVESNSVVSIRTRLADPRGVYTTPGAGENANSANCAGVYKNVKDFVDACKVTYGARYQGLYVAAHQSSFVSEYGKAFSEAVIKTFDVELSRLYPGFLKEATNVGKDVGVAAGKKEIYRQSFSRSELATYSSTLPGEQERVEGEAVALVDQHLKDNAALTLKGAAKLSGEIAPGTEADLKMVLKNIGAKASLGNSLVKIKEISSSLSVASRESAIASVAPKSSAELSVMKIKVSDAAVPGERVVIAGEIIHPGNNYRASRTETFRVEATLKVNPAIDSSVDMDITPKVATLGIVKKHDIDFTIKAKYEGVDQGYEVTIEEVGSNYVRFTNTKVNTERLSRNASKKINFEYKLDKSAKGRTINLKVTVKNGGAVVKATDLQIKPE